jgi:hypothetical protein
MHNAITPAFTMLLALHAQCYVYMHTQLIFLPLKYVSHVRLPSEKVLLATSCQSVCLSVQMYQRGCHETNFGAI